jgi:hypothetical protein
MLVAMALGCGAQAGVVPVSGRVTLGGQPLAGAVVTFQPIRESEGTVRQLGGSVGRTDADGRYELRLIEPSVAGASVGNHRVTITTAKTIDGDDTQLPQGERVPLPWRNGSQTYEVPAEGTTQANFDIP